MNRRAVMLALASFIASPADARPRYRVYMRKRRAPAAEPAAETKMIRIIPIVRWNLWCERIGGIGCP